MDKKQYSGAGLGGSFSAGRGYDPSFLSELAERFSCDKHQITPNGLAKELDEPSNGPASVFATSSANGGMGAPGNRTAKKGVEMPDAKAMTAWVVLNTDEEIYRGRFRFWDEKHDKLRMAVLYFRKKPEPGTYNFARHKLGMTRVFINHQTHMSWVDPSGADRPDRYGVGKVMVTAPNGLDFGKRLSDVLRPELDFEDRPAVLAKMQFNNDEHGREAFAALTAGKVVGVSGGYSSLKLKHVSDTDIPEDEDYFEGGGVKMLFDVMEAELTEVSILGVPPAYTHSVPLFAHFKGACYNARAEGMILTGDQNHNNHNNETGQEQKDMSGKNENPAGAGQQGIADITKIVMAQFARPEFGILSQEEQEKFRNEATGENFNANEWAARVQDSIIKAQGDKMKETVAGKDSKGAALSDEQKATLENGLPVKFKIGDDEVTIMPPGQSASGFGGKEGFPQVKNLGQEHAFVWGRDSVMPALGAQLKGQDLGDDKFSLVRGLLEEDVDWANKYSSGLPQGVSAQCAPSLFGKFEKGAVLPDSLWNAPMTEQFRRAFEDRLVEIFGYVPRRGENGNFAVVGANVSSVKGRDYYTLTDFFLADTVCDVIPHIMMKPGEALAGWVSTLTSGLAAVDETTDATEGSWAVSAEKIDPKMYSAALVINDNIFQTGHADWVTEARIMADWMAQTRLSFDQVCLTDDGSGQKGTGFYNIANVTSVNAATRADSAANAYKSKMSVPIHQDMIAALIGVMKSRRRLTAADYAIIGPEAAHLAVASAALRLDGQTAGEGGTDSQRVWKDPTMFEMRRTYLTTAIATKNGAGNQAGKKIADLLYVPRTFARIPIWRNIMIERDRTPKKRETVYWFTQWMVPAWMLGRNSTLGKLQNVNCSRD